MYLPNTAVLVTRFLSPDGVAEVVDFLPIENPAVVTDRHRVVRMVRGILDRILVSDSLVYPSSTPPSTARTSQPVELSRAGSSDRAGWWRSSPSGDDAGESFL